MSENQKNATLPPGLIWRDGRIHIRTTIAGRRVRRSTGTDDLSEACRQLETLRGLAHVAKSTGIVPPGLRPRVTLPHFVAEVLTEMEADRASPRTLVKYRGTMARFVDFVRRRVGREPVLADVDRPAQRTPRSPNGRPTAALRLPSPRTVAGELDVVRSFLRRAVARGLLAENPEHGVGRPRNAYRHRVRWLEDREAEALLAVAEEWDRWHQDYLRKGRSLRLALDLYLRTGMRSAELRHLTVDDVRLDDGTTTPFLWIRERRERLTALVQVSAQEIERIRRRPRRMCELRIPAEIRQTDPGRWRYDAQREVALVDIQVCWRPKTTERRIPVSPATAQLLHEIFAERKAILDSRPRLAAAREAHVLPPPPWLIPDGSGLPWRWKLPRIMKALSDRAGIAPVVRTHDLRHTFATRLRRAGVPMETLKELLGHADIRETLIYAHYQDDEGLRAISRLDAPTPP